MKQRKDSSTDEDDTVICPMHSKVDTSDNGTVSGNIIVQYLVYLWESKYLQLINFLTKMLQIYFCLIGSMSPEYPKLVMISDPRVLEMIRDNWLLKTNRSRK